MIKGKQKNGSVTSHFQEELLLFYLSLAQACPMYSIYLSLSMGSWGFRAKKSTTWKLWISLKEFYPVSSPMQSVQHVLGRRATHFLRHHCTRDTSSNKPAKARGKLTPRNIQNVCKSNCNITVVKNLQEYPKTRSSHCFLFAARPPARLHTW